MKLPAIQFYPGDWKRDPGVQALSFHDRGIWLEILCLMHESEQRGVLLLGGQPMPDDALARLLGLDNQNLTTTLTTLLTYGVASRDPVTGALVNRRMVRDEELRQIRAESGKKGGNPALKPVLVNQNPTTPLKQNPTTRVNQNPTPSSSSSFSSSASTEEDKRERERGGQNEDVAKQSRRPSLAQAISAAQTIGVSPAKADEWWHAREANEWVKGMAGGGTCLVGTNWQADLKTYAGRSGMGGNGSNGATGRKQNRFAGIQEDIPLA